MRVPCQRKDVLARSPHRTGSDDVNELSFGEKSEGEWVQLVGELGLKQRIVHTIQCQEVTLIEQVCVRGTRVQLYRSLQVRALPLPNPNRN